MLRFDLRPVLAATVLCILVTAAPLLAGTPDTIWVAEADGALRVLASDGTPLAEVNDLGQVRAVDVDLSRESVWLVSGGDLYRYGFDGNRQDSVSLDAPNSVHAVVAGRTEPGGAWVGVESLLWFVDETLATATPFDLAARVRDLTYDPDQQILWVATERSLERVAEGATMPSVVASFSGSERVIAMAVDAARQRVWLALPREVLIFDYDGNEVTRLTVPDVEHLAADHGEVWGATKKELLHFDAGVVDLRVEPFDGAGTIVDLVVTWTGDVWTADSTRLARVAADGSVAQVLVFDPPTRIWQLGHGADLFPPELEILAPQDGSCTMNSASEIVLTWSDVGSGVDPESIETSVDGDPAEVTWQAEPEGAVGQLVGVLLDGLHTLEVVVEDMAGNRSESETTSWTVDTVAPSFLSLEPVDGLLTNDVQLTVSGQVDEPVVLELAAAGSTQSTSSETGAFAFAPISLTEGDNSLLVTATDCAGNHAGTNLSVTLDTVPPDPIDLSLVTAEVVGSSLISVVGRPGAAEVESSVLATHLDTGATAEIGAASDGSFVLEIGGSTGDQLSLAATDLAGNQGEAVTITAEGGSDDGELPPDPSTVALPNDETVATEIAASTSFLYSGPDPIQRGVQPGTIDPLRVSVLRGRVLDQEGAAFAGARVSVLNSPELGWTLSREDGVFDLVVHSGPLVLEIVASDRLPVQRRLNALWRDYFEVEDVVVLPLDGAVTVIEAGHSDTQVARGSTMTDADGDRQATMIFAPGTRASMVLQDGSIQELSTLSVRATEYTVGEMGSLAMPGALPSASGYTYAVELSVDEAIMAGARSVQFDIPVALYVENFLEFPVGGLVPAGWYDREKAAWIPSDNGRVVEILGAENGLAILDIAGEGNAASPTDLDSLGITEIERSRLAALYDAGVSLWRTPISHFTPWDCNWPYGPPEDAEHPPDLENPPDPDGDPDEPEIDNNDDTEDTEDPDCVSGSVIECQNQILRKRVRLPGVPFELTYSSARVQGRAVRRTVKLQISGGEVPASLKRIDLYVDVAGKSYLRSFPPAPHQEHTFVWDGRDRFGRVVSGETTAHIRLAYVYPAVYLNPRDVAATFAQFSEGGGISAARSRNEIWLWSRTSKTLHSGLPTGASIGGWQADPVHLYDTNGRTLFRGNSTTVNTFPLGQEISIAVGQNLTRGSTGDGLPATAATLDDPEGLSIAPDGSLYIADGGRIRRVGLDGIIETVAGGGPLSTRDGIPAREAYVGAPIDVVVAPDGTLFFTSRWFGSHCLFRVEPDGLIYRQLCGPKFGGLDLDSEGSLILAARFSVEQIDRSGRMTRIAGTGQRGYSGDGGPALLASFNAAEDVSVGPDGSIFVADTTSQRVRKISPDGIIVTVAGTGFAIAGPDGIPGTSSSLFRPLGVHAANDGGVFITTDLSRVRWLRSDGIITTVAGRAWSWGDSGDGGPATAARMRVPEEVALAPDGALYISDSMNYTVRVVKAQTLPGYSSFSLTIPSEDGNQLYFFDQLGRHLATRHALTAGLLWKPEYDAVGRLIAVQDGSGNTTQIVRDANGAPKSIEGPFGPRIEFATDAEGYLSSITLPDGSSYRFEYVSQGLLSASIDPNGHRTEYTYSPSGRLIASTDAAGATRTFDRYVDSDGFVVKLTSASGATTEHRVNELDQGGEQRWTKLENGAVVETIRGMDGTVEVHRPDGSILSTTRTGDPRFGLQAGYINYAEVIMPTGLTSQTTSERSATFTTPGDLTTLETLTSETTVNGRMFTMAFDVAAKTFTSTSAEGREAMIMIDDLGRTTRVESPQVEPLSITYRSTGSVESMTVGDAEGVRTRTTSFSYDAMERLDTVTDPLLRTVSFTYDDANRVTQTTLPDGQVVGFGYDDKGNVTSVTPPGQPAHVFTYTTRNLPETYVLPDAGAGTSTETRDYDDDQRLIEIERADRRTLEFFYFSARLESLTTPRGVTDFVYTEPTDQLTSIIEPGGEVLSFTWDGPLLEAVGWTGEINGSVEWTYDTSFRPVTVSVNGANPVTYSYDQDSLVTSAGALSITREADTGREDTTTLGNVTTARTYTPFGEPDTFTLQYNGSTIYAEDLDYDDRGWITDIERTQNGGTHDWSFGYDLRGRLETVEIDGMPESTYGYDANSNRTSYDGQFGTILPAEVAVDARDRLLAYDDITFTYTDAGELLTKTQAGQTIDYHYDVFGNLRTVDLPGGAEIEYVTDGANRRIGKKIDGTLVQGFLYQDALNPIAELDGAGNVVSRFVYATRSNVPDFLVKGGVTYRIVADHLGSVRLVVDVATGTIAQEMRYDEFGRVTLDTSPAFQPFGFAGGVYDSQTGLVRFGARDYDPALGRWTVADKAGFVDGSNLYSYVNSSAIHFNDDDGYCLGLGNEAVTTVWEWMTGHWGRNKNNDPPSYEDLEESGWIKLPDRMSRYHQMGDGGEDNEKWISPRGVQESVYNGDGSLVESPVNTGTYNFGSPTANMLGHFVLDMLPYYLWGNSPTDPTTTWERLTGTYDGPSE